MEIRGADTLSNMRTWARRYAESPRGRTTIRVGRALFLLLIVCWLLFQMTEVGWRAIAESLPGKPLFYILFLALYFLLPLAEVLIYRVTWSFPALRSIPAFVKKRIYNKDVLGYSGEVYFFGWARKNVGLRDARILETIRDNNIISSAASTMIALALLVVFLMVGEFGIERLFGNNWRVYLGVGAAALVLMAPLLFRFRRYLFSMTLRTTLTIFGIQSIRLIVGQILQIGQWEVVMPEVPMRIWFTFAAVSILLTRIPFLPNQNLIFLGAGVELSQIMDISSAGVAGMLLVTNVLDKALNLGLFGLVSFIEPKASRGAQQDSQEAGGDEQPESRDSPSQSGPEPYSGPLPGRSGGSQQDEALEGRGAPPTPAGEAT